MIRLGGTYYDLNGTAWTVNIHDTEYSGGVVSTNVVSHTIQYQANTRDSHAPIMSSAATVKILIQGATQQSFVNDFIGAAEKRFRLEILKGASLEWVGLILTDDVTKEDKEYPYKFEIKATDGLGILKSIDYNNDDTPYDGKERCTEHIINALTKIGTQDLFGPAFLSTAVKWFDTNHASTSVDPFHESRFDHRRFIKIDSSGVRSFESCYSVIKQIVESWGAQIKIVNGTFRIIQINEYEGATFDFFNYTSAKVATAATASATYRKTDATNIIRLDGGKFKYLPAYAKSVVKFKHFQGQSIIPGDAVGTSTFSLDDIDSGGGTSTVLFRTDYKASTVFTGSYVSGHRHKFGVQIKIGSKYLQRTAEITPSGGTKEGTPAWVDSPAYVEYFTNALFENLPFTATTTALLSSPGIPADGDLELVAQYLSTWGPDGLPITSGFTPTLTWYNGYLEVVPAGQLESRSNQFTYVSNNGATGNTAKKELETALGDGPSAIALGSLEVYNGVGWVASSDWGINTTSGNTAFGQLLAQELLFTRAKPAQAINATFKGEYTAIHSVYYGNQDYIPITCSIDLLSGKVNGEFVIINSTGASVTDKNVEAPFEPDGGPLSPITPIGVGSDPSTSETAAFESTALSELTISTLGTAIGSGDSVSTIQIAAIGTDNVVKASDNITLIDKLTGSKQSFTVSSDVSDTDTSIAVNSAAASSDFSTGSIITIDQKAVLSKINSGNITAGLATGTTDATGQLTLSNPYSSTAIQPLLTAFANADPVYYEIISITASTITIRARRTDTGNTHTSAAYGFYYMIKKN